MIAKHFNAVTMCPYGRFALGDAPEMVCHCLVVETRHGLVVVDTGLFAETDFTSMRADGYFLTLMRVARDREATVARRIEMLGYRTKDVRHVVCTHLDIDHAGGIADFPDAAIHVMEAERRAAEAPPTRNERRRYVAKHFAHAPKWTTHEASGESWKGFEAVRALADDEPDLLLVPLGGHTRGHAAVAVRTASGWLLHCGDAYFHPGEMTPAAKAPFGLELFQRTIAVDDTLRRDNQRRLRELKDAHADVTVFCAHSKTELDALSGASDNDACCCGGHHEAVHHAFVLVAWGCHDSAVTPGPANGVTPEPITVSSPAFAAGASIPVDFTCDGIDQNPHITWTAVPTKARSLAIVVDDPDAPSGTFTHWLVWNIKPETRMLGSSGLGGGMTGNQ